jgi:hypothetical protein
MGQRLGPPRFPGLDPKRKMKNYSTSLACVACGLQGENVVCLHHELSRGHNKTFAEDPRVMLPLCSRHHSQRHAIGQSAFIEKFPQYAVALKEKGWIYCELKRVWKFPEGLSTTSEQGQPQKTN